MFSPDLVSLPKMPTLPKSKFVLPIPRQLWRFSIRTVLLLVDALDRAGEMPGAASTEQPPW